jgi:hypothetical protein
MKPVFPAPSTLSFLDFNIFSLIMFLKDFSGLFRLLLFPVKQLLLLAESLVDVPKFINGEQSIPPRECTGEVVFS